MHNSTTAREQITVGADPELFLERDGELKSAIDCIGGIKSAPRPLGREGFFVQEDNVAVEFNIPPASTVEEFVESISWSLKTITDEVAALKFKPSIRASALFPAAELTDPRAFVFGCDPDYNAWKKGRRNPRPRAHNALLRSCGGHIHVGWPLSAKMDRLRLIQLMDLYLGVPSVMMDEDEDRRLLYGKAGAYRPQPWGVEYRTLSNFWLKNKEATKWAYEQTMRAVDRAMAFGLPENNQHVIAGQKVAKPDNYSRFMEENDLMDDIQEAINKGNPDIAQNLIVQHDLTLV